jgi:hypothetical protein
MDYELAKKILEGIATGDVVAARSVVYGAYDQQVAAQRASLPPITPPFNPAPIIPVMDTYTTDVAVFVGNVSIWTIENNYSGYCTYHNEENGSRYAAYQSAYLAWRRKFLGGTFLEGPPAPPTYVGAISLEQFTQWWISAPLTPGQASPDFMFAPIVVLSAVSNSTFDFNAAITAKQKLVAGQTGQPGSISAYNPVIGAKN